MTGELEAEVLETPPRVAPEGDDPPERKSGTEDRHKEGLAGATGTAKVEAEKIQAGWVVNAASIEGLKINLGGGDHVEEISPDHFEPLGPEALDEVLGEEAPDPALVESSLAVLERTGILCVAGRPRSGRRALGLAVAQRLLLRGDADAALRCRPLDGGVRVDPQRLHACFGGDRRRLFLFENALTHGNRDLRRFLHELDDLDIKLVSARLAEAGTRLLFTLDPKQLGELAGELERRGLLVSPLPPTPQQVIAAIRREAARLDSRQGDPEQLEAAVRRFAGRDAPLGEPFAGLPDVVDFCRRHLLDVLEGRIRFEDALERRADQAAWLLDTAERDRELWCELIALTLAASTPSAGAVPWLAHRKLSRHLSAQLRRSLLEEDAALRPTALFASHLEANGLARVEHRPGSEGEVLRFEDQDLARRLWSALLGPARAVSWWLEPQLEELASDSDPLLALLSARALGRISELVPESLLFARLRRWARDEDVPNAMVGNLIRGALASDRLDYVQGVVDWLDRQLRKGAVADCWAACTGLPALADVEPARALEMLYAALGERFGDGGDAEDEDLARLLRRQTEAPDRPASPRDGEAGDRGPTASLYRAVSRRVFLQGAKFALIGFCFAGDRLSHLRRLTLLLRRQEERLPVLLVLLIFERDGVLDKVEEYPVHVRQGAGEAWSQRAFSRLLVSAMLEDATADLAAFLAACWQRFGEVPEPLRGALRRRWVEQFRTWSAEPPEGRVGETLSELLGHLLEAADEELAARVFELLQGDPAFTAGAPGEALAERALSLRSPAAAAATAPGA